MITQVLDSLVFNVIGGGWGVENQDDSHPVRVSVIRGADFPDAEVQSISKIPVRFETENVASSRSLAVGDIVLEASGGTRDRPTGRVVRITEQMISDAQGRLIPASFCKKVRPNPEVVDSGYIYYFLKNWWNEGGAWRFQNQSTGISNLQTKNLLNGLHVPLTDLVHQGNISSFLSALDDKIAANLQVSDLIMRLVQAIYQAAPKSRGTETFTDVARIGGGGTPSTKNSELWGDTHRWATPTDVTASSGIWLAETARRISDEGLESISSKLYPSGSLLMTSRASIGFCAITAEEMAVNQGFIVLESHDPTLRNWLYCQLLARRVEFESWANGATFLELPKRVFNKLEVDMPLGSGVLAEFDSRVAGLVDKVRATQRENRVLTTTRDELLPLLMSGRITVKDAEQYVEKVV